MIIIIITAGAKNPPRTKAVDKSPKGEVCTDVHGKPDTTESVRRNGRRCQDKEPVQKI